VARGGVALGLHQGLTLCIALVLSEKMSGFLGSLDTLRDDIEDVQAFAFWTTNMVISCTTFLATLCLCCCFCIKHRQYKADFSETKELDDEDHKRLGRQQGVGLGAHTRYHCCVCWELLGPLGQAYALCASATIFFFLFLIHQVPAQMEIPIYVYWGFMLAVALMTLGGILKLLYVYLYMPARKFAKTTTERLHKIEMTLQKAEKVLGADEWKNPWTPELLAKVANLCECVCEAVDRAEKVKKEAYEDVSAVARSVSRAALTASADLRSVADTVAGSGPEDIDDAAPQGCASGCLTK